MRPLLVLLAVSTLARLALAWYVDAGVDEAYLIAVSRQFQLSWYDHPPLAFWIGWAMQAVFGPDLPVFVLRLPFVALFTGSTALLYALTAKLYSPAAGLWAVLALSTAPFFLLSAGGWLVPDGPLIFFGLICAWLLSRLLFEERDGRRWGEWMTLGLAAGLMLLAKYHGALFGLGAAAFIALSPAHRHWLARPQPWAALGVAALVFSPVLVWNEAHHWVSFAFQLARVGHAGGAGQFAVAVIGQAVYLLPWTFLALAAMLIGAIRGPASGRAPALFLLTLAAPAVLGFNLLAATGRPVLPHWPMIGWLFAFPLLGHWLSSATGRLAAMPAIAAWASALTTFLIVGAAAFVLHSASLVAADPGLMSFAYRATSWRGLSNTLAALEPELPPGYRLAASNWIDASRIAEALRPALPVLVLGDDAHGFGDLQPGAMRGNDMVFVTPRDATSAARATLAAEFAAIEPLAVVNVPVGGTPALPLALTLALGWKGN